MHQLQCPYCSGVQLSVPTLLVKGGVEELLAMGIQVPQIQQCLSCKATLSPKAFVVGTAEYLHAQQQKAV